MQGYIKLYRKLLENPIFKNPYLLQLFIYCLLRASHKNSKAFYGVDEIDIEPGQFVTGRFELAKDLHENESSTYKRLKRLENVQMVSLKSNNKNTLVTVVNWASYQLADNDLDNEVTAHGQESNSKVTTKEQQSNNKVTQTRMKECKNEKNERTIKDYSQEIENFRQRYDENTLSLIDNYFEILKSTRVSNKISDSIRLQVYEEMAKRAVVVVKYACKTVVDKPGLHSKKEDYFYGIMRNTTADEAENKLNKGSETSVQKNTGNISGYTNLPKGIYAPGCGPDDYK